MSAQPFTRVHQMLEAQMRARPEAIAVQDSDDRRISWQRYHAMAAEQAGQMRALGVGSGDQDISTVPPGGSEPGGAQREV